MPSKAPTQSQQRPPLTSPPPMSQSLRSKLVPRPQQPQQPLRRTSLPSAVKEALHAYLLTHASEIRDGTLRGTDIAKNQTFAGEQLAPGTIYRHMRRLKIHSPRTQVLLGEKPAKFPRGPITQMPWPQAADFMRDAAGADATPEGIASTISTIYGVPESDVYDHLTASRTPPDDPESLAQQVTALHRSLSDLEMTVTQMSHVIDRLKPLLD